MTGKGLGVKAPAGVVVTQDVLRRVSASVLDLTPENDSDFYWDAVCDALNAVTGRPRPWGNTEALEVYDALFPDTVGATWARTLRLVAHGAGLPVSKRAAALLADIGDATAVAPETIARVVDLLTELATEDD